MVQIDTEAEKRYFLEALRLFHEMQWLHNVPVTEVLITASLDAVPEEWMKHLEILENGELNDFVVEKTAKSEWPDSLKAYVDKCKRINRLPPVPALPSAELPRNFKIGLSQKKQHEIMHLANLVHAQCESHGVETIVDLGAGLGYACQILHHLYGYRVLGLERDEEIVRRARARQRKLYPDSLTGVRYARCEVTRGSADAIESALRREFPDASDVCLIGLHACGDLSVSASGLFRAMSSVKLCVLISCCYHKLSVRRDDARAPTSQRFHNFPTSACLREVIATHNFDVGQFLRVPFLRLACQESADKWRDMPGEKHDQHSFHVLARAVLELYSRRNNLTLRKKVRKGTRKSQCSSFQSYVKDSLLRYDLVSDAKSTDGPLEHDELEKDMTRLWEEEKKRLRAVEIYTGLQLMLQLPAESLILQDRLCWLHEQGLEATIVPVMNKCISPRSYAIVSHK